MRFKVNGDEVEASGRDAAIAAWQENKPAAAGDVEVEQLTVLVADLDAEDIYWGMKEIPVEEVNEVTVTGEVFSGDCDLPAGRYKWARDKGHFEALAKTRIPAAPAAPSFEAAAYDYWLGLELSGDRIPARTTAWLRWHEKTIEGGK